MGYLTGIAFFLCLTFSQIAFSFVISGDYTSKWAGIEVTGANSITVEKVRQLLPIKIGETLIAKDATYYNTLCRNIIREKTSFKESCCSILFYGDDTVFLIVDLLDKNNMDLFRKIQKKETAVSRIPNELNALYEKWDDHASLLMSSGNFIKEDFSNGFRDFEDPVLHRYAIQLSKMAKKYNDVLLEITRYSEDNIEREKAADLLSWGNVDENIHILIDWNLLMDPDPGVRNNIARSFLHSVHKADDALLKDLIQAYCHQATLPTHGDRNKALFSLKEIIEAHPKLSSTFNLKCRNNLSYLSEMSILDNVKEPARDILAIINKPSS